MTEILNCGSCELSEQPGRMCGVVARRTVAEVAKLGYDTTSDSRPYSDIVSQLSLTDPKVDELAAQECNIRLLQQESQRRGYGTVTY